MAIPLSIIGNASQAGSFVAQVTGALQATVTAILAEAVTTPDYVVRRKFAQKCAAAVGPMAQAIAVNVASQIQAANPTKYTDLTGAPVAGGMVDADVLNALSAIFTQVAYSVILPS